MHGLEICCTFKAVKSDGSDLDDGHQISVVNNSAAALFSLLEVKLNGRVSLLQQMSQSYNLCSFFAKVLNSDSTRADILWAKELFVMDDGSSKAQAEQAKYIVAGDVTAAAVTNAGAALRAASIANSKEVAIISDLHVPLLRQNKALPPGTRIDINVGSHKRSAGKAETTNKTTVCD